MGWVSRVALPHQLTARLLVGPAVPGSFLPFHSKSAFQRTTPRLVPSVSPISGQFLLAKLLASGSKCKKVNLWLCHNVIKLMFYIPQVCFNVNLTEIMPPWPKVSLSRSGKCNLSKRREKNTTVASESVGLNSEAEKKKKNYCSEKSIGWCLCQMIGITEQIRWEDHNNTKLLTPIYTLVNSFPLLENIGYNESSEKNFFFFLVS